MTIRHRSPRALGILCVLILSSGLLGPAGASAQTDRPEAEATITEPAPVADSGVATSAIGATETPDLSPLQVSHVSADTVYLNGGRSHGISVGQVIAVVRDGEPVAELEVAFVSRKSASCRVLDSRLEIVLGDQAIPVPGLAEAGAPEPEPSDRSEEPATPRRTRPARVSSPAQPWADFSGTVSLRFHHFEDGGEIPRSFDQTTARLNLQTRSNGGAYEARIRVRGREDRRYRESEATETSRSDRLYELALTYAPPDGRVFVEMGRMASSPMLGFDYLDGLMAEYKVKPRFGIGGFYGQRSNIDNIGLGAEGEAYGAFVHYQRKRSKESKFYADLVLGGIREGFEGEVSREFLSLYGRMGSGSRWSLYQRADIDINSDWRREVAGDSYQVSNLLSSFNYRFTDRLRLGISYDHRRRFRELENRDTPEEIFDDRLREGLRLTAQIGNPQGWRLTSSVGVRRAEGTAEDAYTGTGSIFHTNIGGHNLLLGVDFSGFSGETSDGYRVSLRGRKYFDAGHDIGLTVGTSITTNQIGGVVVDSENQWIRLNGTVRLPKRFFLLTEIEVTEGDDLAGERFILQVGYRL